MNTIKSTLISATLAAASASSLAAPLTERAKEYSVDAVTYQSVLLKPSKGGQTGVLLVPDWTGINEHARMQARRLAQQGRIVLIVDLYGKGVQTNGDPAKADAASAPLIKDRALATKRMQAALDALRAELPANAKVASVGYSFGALAALELARSGASISGTVAAWPVLANPTPSNTAQIRGPVLVLQGTQDMLAPLSALQTFAAEMDAAGKAYEVALYGGVKHAYTLTGIPNTPDNPLASDPVAAKKTAQQTDLFLALVLGK